ncbi:hypothetical protein M422DRAFT_261463 [Sphaerobolus stellatus SS14]|uniref:Uncharacterized protein n=1 Tax=Sphaerobolus stellatus (strain SS14) TaxID=990650 RepID=A0A0C9V321_SPHS4|nr:hypothetical protein M422DRAFT_261463 [Sphaerobolus stellatus SS14]
MERQKKVTALNVAAMENDPQEYTRANQEADKESIPVPSPGDISMKPINGSLFALFIINIIFLIDVELEINKNTSLQQKGDSMWTFGQTLALLLLLVHLRDLAETFLKRHEKNIQRVANNKLLRQVLDSEGGEHGTALHAASLQGNLEIAKWLVEKGADINIQGRNHVTALQAAWSSEHWEIVKFLVKKCDDIHTLGESYFQ